MDVVFALVRLLSSEKGYRVVNTNTEIRRVSVLPLPWGECTHRDDGGTRTLAN
jgi:hypothetical protein